MRGKSLSEWSEPSTGLVKDRYHPSDTERAGNFDLPAMGELLLGGLTTSGSWLHGERMLPIVAHMVGRSSRAIDPNRDTGRYAGRNWAPNYESAGETVESSDVDRLHGLPGKLPRPEEKTQPGMLHCDGMGRLDGSTIGSGLQIGDDYFSRPAQTGIPQVR